MERIIKTLLLFTIIISIQGCNRQIITTSENKKNGEKTEKLNINNLYNAKKSSSETIKLWEYKGDKNIEYVLKDKTNNTEVKIYGSSKGGFSKEKRYLDFYYGKLCMIYELSGFDIHGNLISKNTYCQGIIPNQEKKNKLIDISECKPYFHTQIGIWKEYDSIGNLTKETNYDKDFDFNLINVLEYLKSKNMDLNEIKSHKIVIERDLLKCCWIIRYINKEGVLNRSQVILSGETGEVLSETKYNLYNGTGY
ncbi:MAG: hypothetical protein V4572_11145 [Bacteroidota bacterium]